MLNEILICSDFLATREDEQTSNLPWLFDLLERPLKLATGLTPKTFQTEESPEAKLSRSQFFGDSNLPYDPVTLQGYFDPKLVRAPSIKRLKKVLGSGKTLVIGYELSPSTREVLTRAKVPYLDVWLHPIRFLDDILFGFSSNREDVFEALKPYNLDEEIYYLYGTRQRISAYKGWKRTNPSLDLPENTALFVGQTLQDKAVCDRGHMLNALDYKETLDVLASQHSKLLFSRHPYVRFGDEEILDYIEKHPKIELTRHPAYHLIAHPNVKKVVTISSSVAYEAKYYGKDAEFLFRPVINLEPEFGQNNYISIFQDLVSPKFWSTILAPLHPTTDAPDVQFLDRKDKLRDMLNFYWSYAEVDKVENLRRSHRALDNKVQRSMKAAVPNSGAKTKKTPRVAKKTIDILAAKAAIDEAEVVSFDLFDTLIARKIDRFKSFMQLNAEKQAPHLGIDAELFLKKRQEARSLVKEPSLKEEVLLTERYAAMLDDLGHENKEASAFADREFILDKTLLTKRALGCELYNYAKTQNKKIIIVTDTYYSLDQIQALLDHFQLDQHDTLFSSSDNGLLKHTGSVFPYLLETLQIDAADLVHLGDNIRSDVEMAEVHNVRGIHLPSTYALSKSTYLGFQPTGSTLSDSIMNGLNYLSYDRSIQPKEFASHTQKSPYNLGYRTLGPMFYGFGKWIYEQAKQDGIKRLYFLARDGEVIQRSVEAFQESLPAKEQIECRYVLASRRCLNVARLKNHDDIEHLLDSGFSPITLGTFLLHRFGYECRSEAVIRDAGFDSSKQLVCSANPSDIQRIKTLLRLISRDILDNAKLEHDALTNHYKAQDLVFDAQTAVVDIGHNGTLQASLSAIMSDIPLHGYYFVTYSGIIENIRSKGHVAKAYLQDLLDTHAPNHPYKRYLVMFETIFLNAQQSLVRIERSETGFSPVFVTKAHDLARVEFSQQVHSGIEAFVRELSELSAALGLALEITPDEAIGRFVDLLQNPQLSDAELFLGINFENQYAGRPSSWLIDPNQPAHGLWSEGCKLLADLHTSDEPDDASTLSRLMNRLRTMTDFDHENAEVIQSQSVITQHLRSLQTRLKTAPWIPDPLYVLVNASGKVINGMAHGDFRADKEGIKRLFSYSRAPLPEEEKNRFTKVLKS